MIGNIFDGIERPLERIQEISGEFIAEGIGLITLDMEKIWDVEMLISEGDFVQEGHATVQETELITHRLMI